MKIKPIGEKIAIHCTTKEQVGYLVDNKFVKEWALEKSLPIWLISRTGTTISSCIQEIYDDGLTGEEWCKSNGHECVEFTDLIIPELTAEEVIQWLRDHTEGNFVGFFGKEYRINELFETYSPEQIVEKITKWEYECYKKEPEIEWIWKAYVVGGSDYKEAGTEQEAMEWCEYYVKEHQEAKCTYKHVCIVKAVE